ncbi:hypothetical protein EGR_10579 [Echinococcus granulosus]|uniref:Uncharacterized protein n=1 Tax=Echinococcus granulosus TaxID=6210 RepID=W6U216_ECHGR|nr:hypothetical protein EGR_10579 [Echinococcus granulosus]EUB54566.1 hypothetical protein EGR_10579 [Echinococcus granulosus]
MSISVHLTVKVKHYECSSKPKEFVIRKSVRAFKDKGIIIQLESRNKIAESSLLLFKACTSSMLMAPGIELFDRRFEGSKASNLLLIELMLQEMCLPALDERSCAGLKGRKLGFALKCRYNVPVVTKPSICRAFHSLPIGKHSYPNHECGKPEQFSFNSVGVFEQYMICTTNYSLIISTLPLLQATEYVVLPKFYPIAYKTLARNDNLKRRQNNKPTLLQNKSSLDKFSKTEDFKSYLSEVSGELEQSKTPDLMPEMPTASSDHKPVKEDYWFRATSQSDHVDCCDEDSMFSDETCPCGRSTTSTQTGLKLQGRNVSSKLMMCGKKIKPSSRKKVLKTCDSLSKLPWYLRFLTVLHEGKLTKLVF